jgi:hypothetical protein
VASNFARPCSAAWILQVAPRTARGWKSHFFNGKIHYKSPFSIAMFVYQRVLAMDHRMNYHYIMIT